jgi:beta-lactam-binding protein with PASTA domain
MRSLLISIACALAIVAAGCGGDKSSRAVQVVVPDLTGLPQPDAQKELERLGLRWRFGGIDRVFTKAPRPLPSNMHIASDPYDDQVVSQKPDAGERVEPHTIVEFETKCTMLRFKNSRCI